MTATPAQDMVVHWGDPWEREPCDLLPPETFYGP